MIVSKHTLAAEPVENNDVASDPIPELETYEANALVDVYKAVRTILSDLRVNPDDPTSPPVFKTIKLNTGQVNRLKNNTWNKEGALGLPAVFIHFININYLVGQARIAEGKGTLRLHYVLNRLNNGDDDYEAEGFEMFNRINSLIQARKAEFPALVSRFQLAYFDQPESFDDGVQPYWIDYDVWFNDYSGYRYKSYVDTYMVIPPFTNHSDQAPEVNIHGHEDHKTPTFEEVAGFDANLTQDVI